MGRQLSGKGDPGNQLRRKRPPTPLKTQRTLRPRQRASCLWTNGVPPFHATQDSGTLPLSLPKLQSQGLTSPSLHTIKLSRQAETNHLQRSARGGTKRRTDVHFSPTGTTCWHATGLSDACPDYKHVGPEKCKCSDTVQVGQKGGFQWRGQGQKLGCGRLQQVH